MARQQPTSYCFAPGRQIAVDETGDRTCIPCSFSTDAASRLQGAGFSEEAPELASASWRRIAPAVGLYTTTAARAGVLL